jgi:transposase
LKRLAVAGRNWPLPTELTDAALEAQLFTGAGKKQGRRRPCRARLQILWDEYIERNADGYRYSRFCELYRGWASRILVTMRQTHAGGDKLFVDYAGDSVPVIVDRLTGKTRPAQIFVAGNSRLQHS